MAAKRRLVSDRAQSKRSKSQGKKRGKFKGLKIIFGLFFAFMLAAVSAGGAVFWYFWWEAGNDYPTVEQRLIALRKEPSKIVSRDGSLLYTIQSEYRNPISYEDIPLHVRNAVLAAEDKRFLQHSGIDYQGLVRSAITNVSEGRIAQGGSTLTMQLAKRVYSGSERNFFRKVRDMAMALVLEQRMSKERILELYMNQVFFGSGAYGISAAADVYFGKQDLNDLTLAEAAMLARLVQRPSLDNPFRNLDRALANRNLVLANMLEEGWITQQEYEKAFNEKPKLAERRETVTMVKAPYFVRFVLETLRRDYPHLDLGEGGYTIETTMVDSIQEASDRAVRRAVANNRLATTAAFVLMDDQGRVLCLTGGVDFRRNNFDVITQGRRQPGSAFKPFIYSAALELGVISPYSSISNSRLTWGNWTPNNVVNQYGGMVSVQQAMSQSINVAAARVMQMLGPREAVRYSRDVFGFQTPLPAVPSLSLGAGEVSPMEMLRAYSVFMTHGDRVQPFAISRIIGPGGEVIGVYEPQIARGVMNRRVATTMDRILRGVVTGGTARTASSVTDARGKTGTTSSNRDAWFAGYTNNLVGIAWIAREVRDEKNNRWVYQPMPGVFGGNVAVHIWRDVVGFAQKELGVGTRREGMEMDGGTGRRTIGDAEPRERAETPTTPIHSDDMKPSNEGVGSGGGQIPIGPEPPPSSGGDGGSGPGPIGPEPPPARSEPPPSSTE
ncbi:MAG: transglycosylase domain-containing protein [Fimbriimonadaceae bacterium]